MAALLFLALSALILSQGPRPAGDGLDEETRVRMREREEMLKREMARLLREVERQEKALHLRSQQQSGFVWWALQQWQSWALAAALLLLCGRLSKRQPASSSSKEGSPSKKPQKRLVCKAWQKVPLASLDSPAAVQDMLRKLLDTCQKLYHRTCVPRLGRPIILDAPEGCSTGSCVYKVLIPLSAPHGQAFRLEQTPVGFYKIGVWQRCACRQRLICFRHSPEEELQRFGAASIADSDLCRGPYLDLERTYFWFHRVLAECWKLFPQFRHYEPEVLASKRSCTLRLTSPSQSTLLIEMTFGLQMKAGVFKDVH
ncbi:inositol 1,4,5-trisphosphate receptor-interacting protein-like 1 [Apus apus]|uniref:inositol 1,4,5-trisphosphate receptor-interacting protein-like 1 n=1 Tax=Apus apus TaxID=8895 RepID=UPI0021F85C6C|nr:inositol 1,4,5-trisphosphate receptor-interacting protein-like 1 [Apus apus]